MIILQSLLLTCALSADCLATGFAYGTSNIKIPFWSAMIINLICSSALAVSLFFGKLIGEIIPETVTVAVCAGILMAMGLFKIIGFFLQGKAKNSNNKLIKLFAKPEQADGDNNKILSKKEALILSLALSLDGFAAGIGTGLVVDDYVNYAIFIGFSLVVGIFFLLAGVFIGKKIAKKTKINLSWLSGLVLIGIALMKIFI